MPTQIVAVLCEGPHDVAFLNRILKTDGYAQAERTKLGSYPAPMDRLLVQEAKESEVESLNIEELRRRLLPSHVLNRDETYLFLYALGGDSKQAERERLLRSFHTFAPKAGQIPVIPSDTQLTVLYFFDADNQGESVRRAQINREVATTLSIEEAGLFQAQGEIRSILGLRLGCYVFCEISSDKGKLENIILPLMQQGNEPIFEAAKSFLDTHHDPDRLKISKFRTSGHTIVEKHEGKHKYDLPKSLIGTAGQLQVSGAANSVCIGRTDYLTLTKIQHSSKCQEILAFFKKATD